VTGSAVPSARASLRVPADEEMLATLRAFVSRFLDRYSDEDRIDDVRVAVGEACARMKGAAITVSIEVGDARCVVTCEGVVRPGEDEGDVMRAGLLGALADDIEWFRDDAVRFHMPLSA
jgi:hypothetical protein